MTPDFLSPFPVLTNNIITKKLAVSFICMFVQKMNVAIRFPFEHVNGSEDTSMTTTKNG